MDINNIIDGLDGEAKEYLSNFVKTNDDNVERINSLERTNSDLVEQRAEWRKNVRDMAPENAKKEIDNLKAQLDEVATDRQNTEAEYTKELNGLRIDTVLKELDVKGQNADAFKAIGNLALEGTKYEDGGYVYTNEDGTTRYNEDKKPYSVMDKINELKEGEKSYLFKEATGGGFKKDETPKAPNTKPDINDIINRGLKY